MDVFDAIRTRRSIRHFSNVPVEWEKVVRVLEAGSLAPSSGNVQNWRFIVVTDKDLRHKIAEACLEQSWITEAPVIIVVVADLARIKKLYGERGVKLYSIQNCAAAIQNMLLAAHALGLGACWVSAFEDEALSRILGIPSGVKPQAVIPLGYPAEKPPEPMHYTLENLCFFESYGNRIKDIDTVLWNFNVVGKAIDAVKKTTNAVSEKTKSGVKKIVEKERIKKVKSRISSFVSKLKRKKQKEGRK